MRRKVTKKRLSSICLTSLKCFTMMKTRAMIFWRASLRHLIAGRQGASSGMRPSVFKMDTVMEILAMRMINVCIRDVRGGLFFAGRGKGKNPRGGVKVKIHGAGAKID